MNLLVTSASMVLLGLSISSFAQHSCGFDDYRSTRFNLQAESDANTRIQSLLPEFHAGIRGSQDVYSLPVVIHVIHNNGAENISDEQVQSGIENLNLAFANQEPFFDENGSPCPVNFCLAQRDPEGNATSGIVRVQNELTTILVPSQDQAMKDLSRWAPEQYINIWIVKEITWEPSASGVLGYATYPASHGLEFDGIVVEAVSFSDPYFFPVLIHEMGHYLGLYHTFEAGCPNDDCFAQGDRVCDTPPDAVTHLDTCSDGPNSCNTDPNDESSDNPFRPLDFGGIGDQADASSNYMDYSGLDCMINFTQGQSDRIRAALLSERNSLLFSQLCEPPCTNPFIASIDIPQLEISIGSPVQFTNNSGPETEAQWYINGELIAESAVFDYNPIVAGNFQLVIIISNGIPGCNQTFQYGLNVSCPADTDFAASASWVVPGEEALFSYTGPPENELEWIVDGIPVSNNSEFAFSTDVPASYTITLSVSNGTCTRFSSPFLLEVSSCPSGNESNIWVLYGINSQVEGLDFNESPAQDPDYILPVTGLESKSTFCRSDGSLWLSAAGTTVYDSGFNPINNGTDILGHPSARQGSLFVRKPGSDSLLYLFHQDAQETNFANGLRYSLINLNGQNGAGEILPDQKNIFIDHTGNESLTCIRHCNGRDFWLLTYDHGDLAYQARHVDPNGVSDVVVESPYLLSNIISNFTRDFKVTPVGDFVMHDQRLLSFDTETGELEEIYLFSGVVAFYDFSPNGRFLYIMVEENAQNLRLYQIDLSLDPSEFIQNDNFLSFNFTGVMTDIKTAPDGKIYCAKALSGSIAIIQSPNNEGIGNIGFQDNAIAQAGIINSFGNYFHQYTTARRPEIMGENIVCTNSPFEISLANTPCAAGSPVWLLPEGGEVLSQQDLSASVVFPQADSFRIIATMESGCGPLSDTILVSVQQSPQFSLGPDLNLCEGQSLMVSGPSGEQSYVWNTGQTTAEIAVNLPGTYWLQVTNATGCTAIDSIHIPGFFSGIIDLGPDLSLCDNEFVILDAGSDFTDYTWHTGQTGSIFTVYQGGIHYVTATIPCIASDTLFIDDCGIGLEITGSSFPGEPVLFPNPASHSISITNLPEIPGLQLRVYDISGRAVRSEFAWLNASSAYSDLSQLSPGSYILEITSGFYQTYRIRFIVE